MATGAAIIIVNSPTPVAAMAAPATESPVSSPSTTLAPIGIFYTVMLWSPVPFPGGIWPQPHAEVSGSLQSSPVVGKVPSCLTITAVWQVQKAKDHQALVWGEVCGREPQPFELDQTNMEFAGIQKAVVRFVSDPS